MSENQKAIETIFIPEAAIKTEIDYDPHQIVEQVEDVHGNFYNVYSDVVQPKEEPIDSNIDSQSNEEHIDNSDDSKSEDLNTHGAKNNGNGIGTNMAGFCGKMFLPSISFLSGSQNLEKDLEAHGLKLPSGLKVRPIVTQPKKGSHVMPHKPRPKKRKLVAESSSSSSETDEINCCANHCETQLPAVSQIPASALPSTSTLPSTPPASFWSITPTHATDKTPLDLNTIMEAIQKLSDQNTFILKESQRQYEELEKIALQNAKTLNRVASAVINPPNDFNMDLLEDFFPISSLEGIADMDQRLSNPDFNKKVRSYLSALRPSTKRTAIKSFRFVFSDDVMCFFNYMGTNDKKSFDSLSMNKIMQTVWIPSISKFSYDSAAREFIRRARERVKARKRQSVTDK